MDRLYDEGVDMLRRPVKICGVTDVGDAEHAAAAGAWAIGMVFWPPSVRVCDLAVAARIGRVLHRDPVLLAGVFVNAELDYVTEVADVAGLSLIQLHGDEGPIYCAEVARRTGAQVIKAMRISKVADVQAIGAYRTDMHLLDAHVPGLPGGSGETFDWELARSRRSAVPLILSGGLNPGNVAAAIEAVEPFAVDVASGVESAPGIKDRAAVEAMIAAAGGPAPQMPRVPRPETVKAVSARGEHERTVPVR